MEEVYGEKQIFVACSLDNCFPGTKYRFRHFGFRPGEEKGGIFG